MAFKIGAFARGFATAAVEEKKEKENEVKELVKASYLDSLQEAKELRKERKAKREKLKELGAQLKQFGFSDAQSAGLLSMGEDGAKRLLELGQTAKINNKDFDVAAFYQVAEDSDLTLDDAINRTMGELKKPATDQLPGFAKQTSFLGGDMTGFAKEQFGQYESSFGEDYQQLRAEAAGEYEYGELPSGTIDYSMLKLDKTEEEKLRLTIAKKQLALAEKELKEADENDLTIGDQGSAGRYIKASIGANIAAHLGKGITYDKDRGYIGPKGQQAILSKAETMLNRATERGIAFINASPSKSTALNGAVTHLIDTYLPELYGTGTSATDTIVTPDELAAAETAMAELEGATASTTESTVAQPATEAEISAFLDQQFSDPSYANIADVTSKKNAKAKIKAQARDKLVAGGMSAKDANDLIFRLTKGK